MNVGDMLFFTTIFLFFLWALSVFMTLRHGTKAERLIKKNEKNLHYMQQAPALLEEGESTNDHVFAAILFESSKFDFYQLQKKIRRELEIANDYAKLMFIFMTLGAVSGALLLFQQLGVMST